MFILTRAEVIKITTSTEALTVLQQRQTWEKKKNRFSTK